MEMLMMPEATGNEKKMEVVKLGPGQKASDPALEPLYFKEILEKVCAHLPFDDLKNARLVNHFWFGASTPAWSLKSQVRIKDIHNLRDFLAKSVGMRKVLPYTTTNWIFQGESIIKLWMDQGLTEQDLMKPFWPTVKSLTLSQWLKRRFRYEQYNPDPNRPHYRQFRRVPYMILTRIGSAYAVTNSLKLCSNLTQLVIHYPLLSNMKGAFIGPRQFPQLEKLTRFEIYLEGLRWANDAGDEENGIVAANMRRSDADIALPADVSGGNTLVLRVLDHSPNLVSIRVTSGTLLTTRLEQWLMGHLLSRTVNLPKLEELRCSVPLLEDICTGMMARPWPLKALHLRVIPGAGHRHQVTARALHDMIGSFKDTIKHLELLFVGLPDNSGGQVFSGNLLYNLESLELWGYAGSHSFVREMKNLKKAVIGVTEAGRYETLRKEFDGYGNAMPKELDLEFKTYADYIQRLDQGPLML